jgi:hypothetical protein
MTPSWIKIHRVRVAGVAIAIEFDAGLHEFGTWHRDEQIIKIGPKAEDCFWETLRHEMTHAALDLGGVSFCETMEVEAVVRCLDNLLFPAWEAIQPIRQPMP